MALEYALNTPNIAAAAVYAAPDPYRDHNDPCAQTPYTPYFTPILDLHFQCDVNNNCVTAQAFFADLNSRYTSKLIAEFVIVDSSFQPASTCDLSCTGSTGLGLQQHIKWPKSLNDKIFFNFFRQHPFQ